MEPARAMVKNRKRLHANTERCNDEKDGDNLCIANKMAGVMGLARRGT